MGGSYLVSSGEDTFGDLGALTIQYAHRTKEGIALTGAYTSYFSSEDAGTSIYGFDFGAAICMWGSCFQSLELVSDNLTIKKQNQGLLAHVKLSQRTVQISSLSSTFVGPSLGAQYIHPYTEAFSFTAQTQGSFLMGSEQNVLLTEVLFGVTYNF